MKLILARHGNTFAPGDPVVWVGKNEDLPLVEKGRAQAQALGAALTASQIIPAAIYCGPLQRTYEYAKIICAEAHLNLRPIVEPRIAELDYGAWGGKSNDEVIAHFGEERLRAWTEDSRWPEGCGWGSSEQTVTEEVRSFLASLQDAHTPSEVVLIVSSNGRLRYFLKAVDGEFERRRTERALAMKTGNVGLIELTSKAAVIRGWNLAPAEL